MSFCGHIDTVRCPNCMPRVYEQQVPVDQVTTTTTTRFYDPPSVFTCQRPYHLLSMARETPASAAT